MFEKTLEEDEAAGQAELGEEHSRERGPLNTTALRQCVCLTYLEEQENPRLKQTDQEERW